MEQNIFKIIFNRRGEGGLTAVKHPSCQWIPRILPELKGHPAFSCDAHRVPRVLLNPKSIRGEESLESIFRAMPPPALVPAPHTVHCPASPSLAYTLQAFFSSNFYIFRHSALWGHFHLCLLVYLWATFHSNLINLCQGLCRSHLLLNICLNASFPLFRLCPLMSWTLSLEPPGQGNNFPVNCSQEREVGSSCYTSTCSPFFETEGEEGETTLMPLPRFSHLFHITFH